MLCNPPWLSSRALKRRNYILPLKIKTLASNNERTDMPSYLQIDCFFVIVIEDSFTSLQHLTDTPEKLDVIFFSAALSETLIPWILFFALFLDSVI